MNYRNKKRKIYREPLDFDTCCVIIELSYSRVRESDTLCVQWTLFTKNYYSPFKWLQIARRMNISKSAEKLHKHNVSIYKHTHINIYIYIHKHLPHLDTTNTTHEVLESTNCSAREYLPTTTAVFNRSSLYIVQIIVLI